MHQENTHNANYGDTCGELILASGSPRRLAILAQHGVKARVVLPEVDESSILAKYNNSKKPDELAKMLALAKAEDVCKRIVPGNEQLLVLAADTIVYKEGIGILGKPDGRDAAISTLMALRNTSHQVFTGVALIKLVSSGKNLSVQTLSDFSTVFFSNYSLNDIETFLAIEPPYDKAGSYGAQGYWSRYIKRIDGDYENVIGLPWHLISGLL
ncbi:MAG: Maf family protein [Coriobacteriales bacterium]|jgi:septum formation protein|nr:Maf family protein [Coriobacteriales bacterium]